MRTTITFDADTSAAVEQLRRERGTGVSAAVNELVRRGAAVRPPSATFVQRTSAGHATRDVSDIADVLDDLEQTHGATGLR